jgi:hypothetical protein
VLLPERLQAAVRAWQQLGIDAEHQVDRYEIGGGGAADVGGHGHAHDRTGRFVPHRRPAEPLHDRLLARGGLHLEPARALPATEAAGGPHPVGHPVREAQHAEGVVPQLVDAPQRRHPRTVGQPAPHAQHGDVPGALRGDRDPPRDLRGDPGGLVPVGLVEQGEVELHPLPGRSGVVRVAAHGRGDDVGAGGHQIRADDEPGADRLAVHAEDACDHARGYRLVSLCRGHGPPDRAGVRLSI